MSTALVPRELDFDSGSTPSGSAKRSGEHPTAESFSPVESDDDEVVNDVFGPAARTCRRASGGNDAPAPTPAQSGVAREARIVGRICTCSFCGKTSDVVPWFVMMAFRDVHGRRIERPDGDLYVSRGGLQNLSTQDGGESFTTVPTRAAVPG